MPEISSISSVVARKYSPIVTDFTNIIIGRLKASEGKFISKIVVAINARWPLENMKFFKRVRKVQENGDFEIILCECDKVIPDLKPTESFDMFPLFDNENVSKTCRDSLGIEYLDSFYNFYIKPLPKKRPLTKQQYEAYSKYWSMGGFREDFEIERLLQTELAFNEYRKILEQVMKISESKNDEICKHIGSCCSQMAILFNESEILCQSLCQCLDKPYRHSALELVAKWAQICKEKRLTSENQHTEQYLCNNLNVFLTHECCPMCAMSLVHSRVKNVWFAESNPLIGALQSSVQMHLNENLNHRYKVFKINLTEQ